MSAPMRAKMKINSVLRQDGNEIISLTPVCRPDSYPADGTDEDNTFAKFSPSGALTLTITNPELIGKFNPNEVYYLDFTPVPQPEAAS